MEVDNTLEANHPSWKIEVFFDGLCPLCMREMEFLRARDSKREIRFTDLTGPDFNASDYGLTQEQLEARIHARLPSGLIIEGVEVFRRLYTIIGWGFWVPFSRLPLIRNLFDVGYTLFAKNRLRLTGRCKDEQCDIPTSAKS